MTRPLKPRERRGWTPPRLALDPLALLLRERYSSRAALSRASGLGYQMLRTYTDGLWTCEKPPSVFVLAMLGTAVDPDELNAAVNLLSRPAPALRFGQQVVLEALRGLDDDLLVTAAPYIHDLLRDGLPQSQPRLEEGERAFGPGSPRGGEEGASHNLLDGYRVVPGIRTVPATA